VFDLVDLYIAPSGFMADKLREFAFYPERVVHVDHFLAPTHEAADTPPSSLPSRGTQDRVGYVLYAGRLLEDKGIQTLLASIPDWGGVGLKIAGDGPMREAVIDACRRHPCAQYVGKVEGGEVQRLLRGALAAVVPSLCYENQPYAVLEAFAAGRPVVGSSHGSLPEMIGDRKRGLMFRPGDPEDLARAVRHLAGDPAAASEMGRAGRLLVETRFSPQSHYERLMSVYDRASGRKITDAA